MISSIPLKSWLIDALPSHIRPTVTNLDDPDAQFLLCVSSSASGNLTTSAVHAGCIPLLPGYFSGVGDLFSAFTLAHFEPPNIPNSTTSSDAQVSHAASIALTKTHAILSLTHEHSQGLPEEERQPTDDEKDVADPLRKTKRMRGRELRLVQAQDIIRGVGLDHPITMEQWDDFWKPQGSN